MSARLARRRRWRARLDSAIERESASILISAVAGAVAFAFVDTAATLLGFVIPTAWFALVASVLTGSFAVSIRALGRVAVGLGIAAAAAFFATLYVWPMTPRKRFFRDMQSIELGMTREQVNATGARWLPGHPYGRAPWLGAEPPAELAFFHHGRGGRYFAADYCEVTFAADRVACVELVAD